MYKCVHIEVTKSNFGSRVLAVERDVWVGEDCSRVVKEEVQQVVL